MAEIRYPPEPEPGETRQEYYDRVVRAWRMKEKRKLLRERGRTCEREGCMMPATQLDECLMTRRDAMGLPVEKYRKVFASCNLAVLCRKCNTERAHDRDGAWERAVARYGRERVVKWYQGLQLKAPRTGWLK